ncbi:diaminopimelate epimerase [Streptomyces sp. NPDC007808]|uniref:diaminopimelate epimerase n=1 Tax=Streptomyces sp. NPDC007808 TaxID=3364779 RepID=UPI0036C29B3A
MTAEFFKYEALGNDYVVIDTTRSSLAADGEVARRVSDRRRGVGADGVMFGPLDAEGRPGLRVFNADGSECPGSGNGLRIFAHFLRERGHVGQDRFSLRTVSGTVEVRVLDLARGLVEASLGPAAVRPVQPLPVGDRTFDVSLVTVGSPHCVVVVPQATRDLAERWGPLIGGHPRFPDRVNVEFVTVLDRCALAAEVWERAAGYTPASGAGACAAALAAHRLGHVDSEIDVRMPGGRLEVTIGAAGDVALRGGVRRIVEGVFSDAFRQDLAEVAVPGGL